ncbi:uncharacterized protein LOC123566183 isoform X3 [Mercenaria mercenaria]|uniref:uncharacterized protein LOC123566183 isoform X3 n=1 Tax=Mercenaria mercenaria TaxID=6596 RepID=UPI00234ED24B|nr:uncharacterized protein LOC123566183 isoform X3 [Mercenaria mercenaria]
MELHIDRSLFEFEQGNREDARAKRAERRGCLIRASVAVIVALVILGGVIVTVWVTTKEEEAQTKTTDIDRVDEETTGCGPFKLPYSGSGPTLIVGDTSSFYRTGCKISGNCWTRKQCYDCLKGPNRDRVGNLNHIPVCCPHCGRYGLTLSWSSCYCNS